MLKETKLIYEQLKIFNLVRDPNYLYGGSALVWYSFKQLFNTHNSTSLLWYFTKLFIYYPWPNLCNISAVWQMEKANVYCCSLQMSTCAVTLSCPPNGLVRHVQTLFLMRVNQKSLMLPHMRKDECIYLEWPDLTMEEYW